MLKKSLLFLFLSVIYVSCFAQSFSYSIEGTASNELFDNEKLYLLKLENDRSNFVTIDSTTVKDGRFSFLETVNPGDVLMRFISVPDLGPNIKRVIFIADKGNISISLDNKYKVGGTKRNIELQSFFDLQESLQQKLKGIVDKYDQMDLPAEESYMKRLEEISPIADELSKATFEFAQSNIKSDIGEAIALSSHWILSPDQMLELMKQARPLFRDSDAGKSVINFYETQNLKSGKGIYRDIKLKNPEGKTIALSDYVGKNKVVLIDFWASWCGPCIKEMPNIVKAYQKYKDKGLEIVGISLDENKQSWVNAIQRLNITWPQMSDLGGWKSEAALLYGVESIPFALLVDKDGNALAGYLHGELLFNKLEELLD